MGSEEMPAKWHCVGPHTYKCSARRRGAMLNTPYWKSWTEKTSTLLQLLDTSQGAKPTENTTHANHGLELISGRTPTGDYLSVH